MGRFSNITDKLGLGSSIEDDLDQIQNQLKDLDLQRREAEMASNFAENKGFEDIENSYGEALDAVEDALAQGEADHRSFDQNSPKAVNEAGENASTLMEYARQVDEARNQGMNQVENNYGTMAESINTGIEVMNQIAQENHSMVSEEVDWGDLDSQVDELDSAYESLMMAEMELSTSVYRDNPDQVQDKFEDILGDQVEGQVTYEDVETAVGEAKNLANAASSYLSEADKFENNCAAMSGTIEEAMGYWSDAAEKLQ